MREPNELFRVALEGSKSDRNIEEGLFGTIVIPRVLITDDDEVPMLGALFGLVKAFSVTLKTATLREEVTKRA